MKYFLTPTPVFLCLLCAALSPRALAQSPAAKAAPANNYVIIGWNDLGMHCISPRFAEMAILPPYNNLKAIVIRRGEDPQLITTGFNVTYSLVNNTTVVGKSDFWRYAPFLFGKQLRVGFGLTDRGLSGKMARVGDHFEAIGIPALPFFDNGTWNPYQLATLSLVGAKSQVIAAASVTVPVSDEMNCVKCHNIAGPAAKTVRKRRPVQPTVEANILGLHDRVEGTRLMYHRPVLCASCHSDNALGTPGAKGVSSLSLAMHGKHATVTPQPTCYDCHPGAKTQCLRSAIPAMGPVKADPGCQRCHGTLANVASSIEAGRQPWLEEPTCAQCHGPAYSTGAVLYRNAKGHGGVYCVACHNSPHAWYPSRSKQDNAQPLTLQGNTKALGYNGCQICHTDGRSGTMPPHNDDGGD